VVSVYLSPVYPALGIAALYGAWWAAVAFGATPGSFLSRFGPDAAISALVRLASTGELWVHLGTSLRRVAIGLAIATVIGIPLGYLTGRFRTFAQASGAPFLLVRMVSPLSWTPLAIVLLGVGDRPVVFLIAIAATWPIVANVAAGVAALDPRWRMVARSLGATPREVLRTVEWPGIRTHVLTGLRLAVGLAWVVLVPAEMLGVTSGIGYFALNTRDRLAYPELMASILAIGASGVVIDAGARWAFRERRRPRDVDAGTTASVAV
jgi:NitT/TauT family transport system permease protein